MDKKIKGGIGCIGCGTSVGCFFPLSLGLGIVLIVAISSYFDTSYRWEEIDTWMTGALVLILIPSIFAGLLQAAVGIWGILGFFDDDIPPLEEFALNKPLPVADDEKNGDEAS